MKLCTERISRVASVDVAYTIIYSIVLLQCDHLVCTDAVSRPMEATPLSPQGDKKRRGAAAYDTLRSNFNTIFPFVNLDTVSHALLPHKVVSPQEIQMFRAAPTPNQQVEKLLFTVMPKVKARPEWFDVFCDALESSAGPEVVNELRGTHIVYTVFFSYELRCYYSSYLLLECGIITLASFILRQRRLELVTCI